jgi:hypothetical protein
MVRAGEKLGLEEKVGKGEMVEPRQTVRMGETELLPGI